MKFPFLALAIWGVCGVNIAAAQTTRGAAITITTPDDVRILKLEVGQPRLYDSKPLRVIEKFIPELAGWEFTSTPQRIKNSYQIHVNKACVIYAFGGYAGKRPSPREFLGKDASRWEPAEGAIEGTPIGACYKRKVTPGETISLLTYELQLAAESIALSGKQATSPARPENNAPSPRGQIAVLTEQGLNANQWVTADLDRAIPLEIRNNIVALKEDLQDEFKTSPVVSQDAYAKGVRLCNALIEVLDERDQKAARAGFRAVEANARTGITSPSLEARRNYKMSWPQFAREQAERKELKGQAINNAAVMKARPFVEWSERAAVLRKSLDALYAQFREAVRQSPSPN